ncbi:MAG TPA: acetyl-CoA carboxylase carboxyltransferase subunit alpha [Chloroflexota bacterium]|jgi:acetyl-CoA carboxylase carboxyl transferase subunit alpha|nr:acetyl-CoA carboxylase carboxyltransferase subunit alpha [Chloroflexota bacterium]
MSYELEFEEPVRHLDAELSRVQRSGANEERVRTLESEIDAQLVEIYGRLNPWETVQVARHHDRPYTLDFVKLIFSDFIELHGDRRFGDDRAILGGPALLHGIGVMVIGNQKGRDTKGNVDHNFGMPNPEGYRKAIRLFHQAEKLGLPVITLVDTPGANPSLPAEERGQAQAIAESIAAMLSLRTPTIAVITGEGGSGGALGIAVADRLLMLEHSIFTVASPEAAASILWRDSAQAPAAAASMKIRARDLVELGIVDGIIPEPAGGAHRDHVATARNLREAIETHLGELRAYDVDELVRRRQEKYRRIGAVA